MNKRLQQFLSAENISQSQFADKIGVTKASVSHILSGRNKPGFEFIESMADCYPNLNLDWLIGGKGRMYKTRTITRRQCYLKSLRNGYPQPLTRLTEDCLNLRNPTCSLRSRKSLIISHNRSDSPLPDPNRFRQG